MGLTRKERAELERLQAKSSEGNRSSRRHKETQGEDDDRDGIYVFSGRHADSFLSQMFGSGSSKDDYDEDDDEDEDDDDDDEDEDDVPDSDPEPPAGNRFFRGRK